jgi:galactokinase
MTARDSDSLVRTVTAAFAARTGSAPAWRWFVPGRIEIAGKHTDYAGGHSLVAAIPRGFVVAASPRPDALVRVYDAQLDEEATIDYATQDPAPDGWARYVDVVVRRLSRDFPGAALGADIAIASNLPPAAGLSSSSALVVGISTALIARAELDRREEWRQAIHSKTDLAGYLGAVENGLAFSTLPGAAGVGTHGGSEDHTAILCGRADTVSAYSYVPVRHVTDAPMPADWVFVVAASGVEAHKTAGARDQYNRASLATQALADVWRRAGGAGQTLAQILRAPGAVAELRERIARFPHPDFAAEALRVRLDHFVREDARVLQFAEAFRRGDAARLGALSRESHDEADRLLDNQIAETRALAALAYDAGGFAASAFGAGFGGSVWALAPTSDGDAVAARWLAEYRKKFPARFTAETFVTRPGKGVIDLPST